MLYKKRQSVLVPFTYLSEGRRLQKWNWSWFVRSLAPTPTSKPPPSRWSWICLDGLMSDDVLSEKFILRRLHQFKVLIVFFTHATSSRQWIGYERFKAEFERRLRRNNRMWRRPFSMANCPADTSPTKVWDHESDLVSYGTSTELTTLRTLDISAFWCLSNYVMCSMCASAALISTFLLQTLFQVLDLYSNQEAEAELSLPNE